MTLFAGVFGFIAGALLGAGLTYWAYPSMTRAAIQLWKRADEALTYADTVQQAYVATADPKNVN
jgi:hypothetical protein